MDQPLPTPAWRIRGRDSCAMRTKRSCLREKKGDVQRLQLQKDDDIPEPSRNEMTEQRNHGTLTHDVAERCLIETTKQRYVSLHLSEEEEEVYEMTVPLPKETETRTRTRTFETGRPSLRRRTETGRVPQEYVSARHKGEGRRDEEAIRDWSVCTNCIARGEECVPNWGVWGKNPEDSACAPFLGIACCTPQRVPERLRAYREMNLEKWEVQLEDLLHVRARAKFEVKFWEERFAEADARLDEHLTRRPRPRTRLTSSPNKREVADDELSYVESSVSESEGITTTED
ncbi:hypothetical protein B0F90DRAFT_1670626 [Multifurca ochricompacta]|uniref:Uncharacterized protein n=1 Tax=Multifurca ochricompacta TaxID=376703 RepID=A0AAD4LY10_9AGAM|nr:hypothetical protein B0F90DRAFT_1670626 [Multifurca ochricompacta]